MGDFTYLSEDVLLLVAEVCSTPLAPKALCHLAAASRQTLTILRPRLTELRAFRAEAEALCSKELYNTTRSELAGIDELYWYTDVTPPFGSYSTGNPCGLTTAELTVLGRLLQSKSLPCLEKLYLDGNQIDDHGIAALMHSLGNGPRNHARGEGESAREVTLPNLKVLSLKNNRFGGEGAQSLFSATAVMPNLCQLYLMSNRVNDTGMSALASTIANGALPNLAHLDLDSNVIEDEGIKSFSSAISSGHSLAKLEHLSLNRNQIGNEGMRALALALAGGALPALVRAFMRDNPGETAPVKVACACRQPTTALYCT